MVGVAPDAKCLCVKGLSDQGSRSYQAIANAIDYCVKQKVDLISMSLGGSSSSDVMKTAIILADKLTSPLFAIEIVVMVESTTSCVGRLSLSQLLTEGTSQTFFREEVD